MPELLFEESGKTKPVIFYMRQGDPEKVYVGAQAGRGLTKREEQFVETRAPHGLSHESLHAALMRIDEPKAVMALDAIPYMDYGHLKYYGMPTRRAIQKAYASQKRAEMTRSLPVVPA